MEKVDQELLGNSFIFINRNPLLFSFFFQQTSEAVGTKISWFQQPNSPPTEDNLNHYEFDWQIYCKFPGALDFASTVMTLF